MAWDKEQSRRRVAVHDSSTFVVKVSDLCRDMDFENLGDHLGFLVNVRYLVAALH